jgi:hypothetical protein
MPLHRVGLAPAAEPDYEEAKSFLKTYLSAMAEP